MLGRTHFRYLELVLLFLKAHPQFLGLLYHAWELLLGFALDLVEGLLLYHVLVLLLEH